MLITVREYAEKIGKAKATVNQAIIKGKIKAVKKLNKFYIDDATEWYATKPRGFSKDPLYNTWNSMRHRCYNPKCTSYHYYGGKGVRVCDEWMDPEAFYKWMYQHGWEAGKGLSIDRIDNDGDYCPENCRVIPLIENTERAKLNRKPSDLIAPYRELDWVRPKAKYADEWERALKGTRFHAFAKTGFLRDDIKAYARRCNARYGMVRSELEPIPCPDDEYIKKYRKYGPSYL